MLEESQIEKMSVAERLQAIEASLRARGARVRRGGAYDRWDLEVRGGLLGAARSTGKLLADNRAR